MPHFEDAAFLSKMFSKIDLANVTFSTKWRRILKLDNPEFYISIYLDLLELSNNSKDKKLKYKNQNNSFKNLLSVFGVSDISEIKTSRISKVKEKSDFKGAFEEFSKIVFSDL